MSAPTDSTTTSPALSSAHEAGFAPRLTYAIAPPNQSTPLERRRAIAREQSARIPTLPIDALLVYDVQDEAERNGNPRPFAFMPKVDPLTYALDELRIGEVPLVVYRAVAEQDEPQLCDWLGRLQARRGRAILVGTPSPRLTATLSLPAAYSVCRRHAPELNFGGIVIAERHQEIGGEDARVCAKARQGCRFFVSQTVWSADATKQLLSDLSIRADREGTRVPPIVLTLSPCGSAQTLDFLGWLGVNVPPPVKRELLSAKDMLTRSVELAEEIYADLLDFAAERGLTVGCNVESVSARAAEVEASVELLRRIDRLDHRPRVRHAS